MQKTTTKKISTISYNSEDFLIDKLNQLIKYEKIAYYIYVKHFAEKDEENQYKKEHIHLLIEPYGKIDVAKLKKEFDEIDIDNPDKPFGCMPFRVTNDFGDWFLYCSHDKDYLLSKGLVREYFYNREDFKTNDNDNLTELIHTINFRKYKKDSEIIKALQSGANKFDLLKSGLCSMREFYQYERSIDVISRYYSDRLKGFERVDTDDDEILQRFN